MLYLNARSWDISPSEFWDMTLAEWLAEYEHRQAQQKGGSSLSEQDYDRLSALMKKEKKNELARHQNKDNG